MRKFILLAGVVIFTAVLPGCVLSDLIFGAFSGYYSGGGYSAEEKQYHYRQQVEAARNYENSSR